MKVVFVTQNDPFYTKFFFERYLQIYPQIDYELTAVLFLPPMNDSLLKLVRRTLDFYGKKNFIRLGVRYSLTKIGEKFGLKTTALNKIKQAGIPVRKITDTNAAHLLEWFRENETDIIVSVSAPQIFKTELLKAPKLACINIHSGKIPTYRGLFPNFWQMKNNEHHSTVTFHEMAAKLDKGNIIKEYDVEIGKTDSLTDLIRKTKHTAAEKIGEVIALYAKGKVQTYEHTNLQEHYYKFPAKTDVAEFLKSGKRIL